MEPINLVKESEKFRIMKDILNSNAYRDNGKTTQMLELAALWASRGENVLIIMYSYKDVKFAETFINQLLSENDFKKVRIIPFNYINDQLTWQYMAERIFIDHYILDTVMRELAVDMLAGMRALDIEKYKSSNTYYDDPYKGKGTAKWTDDVIL